MFFMVKVLFYVQCGIGDVVCITYTVFDCKFAIYLCSSEVFLCIYIRNAELMKFGVLPMRKRAAFARVNILKYQCPESYVTRLACFFLFSFSKHSPLVLFRFIIPVQVWIIEIYIQNFIIQQLTKSALSCCNSLAIRCTH